MPWNDNTGGNSGGPWGQRPSGGGGGGPRGGGGQPPDLEDIIRRSQDRLKSILPGGAGGGITFFIGVGIVLAVWLLSGIYVVEADEQGVVLRFGEAVSTTEPGLHYHWPYPIETVQTPQVTKNNQIDIGTIVSGRPNDEEGLMLTGDENIAYIEFSVNWRIKYEELKSETGMSGTFAYLFNIESPEDTVRAVAESAMREVVGKYDMEFVRLSGRERVQQETKNLTQEALDFYGSGVLITQIQITEAPPPKPVEESFLDLVAARQDRERIENEALRYQNRIVPEACGQAFRVIQQSEGYRQQTVEESIGQTARFTSIYSEYRNNKEVTRERIFLETMEKVMGGMNKVIIDQDGGSSGVVPYLPLNELQKSRKSEEETEK